MIYPRLPYKGDRVAKKLVDFRGINVTENYKEGELEDSEGITSEKYPVLMPRKGREIQATYSSVTDLYEWDGKMVAVAGNKLYFDGVPIENVTSGPKQFAVVNTHLIVMPDNIDIDMTSEYYDDKDVKHFKYKRLDAGLSTIAATNSSTFSEGCKITGQLSGYVSSFNSEFSSIRSAGSSRARYCFYTYGKDKDAVAACYKNGAWDFDALEEIEQIKWFDEYHEGDEQFSTKDYQGFIFIPQLQGGGYEVVSGSSWDGDPDKSLYNTNGYYMTITEGIGVETDSSGNIVYEIVHPGFDVYLADAQLWSDSFYVGDIISMTGTTDAEYDFTDVQVQAIDDSTNTITVKALNSETGVYDADAFPTTTKSFSLALTFTKQFPTLDYICEKGNRLWGLSNKDKTIYASALGLPGSMYDFSGLDTDSYSVAVGSEGDFTGIANYGDAVVCFKENTIHKILGDYPSNFYMSQYKVDGVQKGSYKSLCNINEVLYYKGVNGVYAYTGSSPSLISSSLGRDIYHAAVGGSDGQRYYISMHDADENELLYVYDLHNGLWIKEDDIYVDAFTKLSGVQIDDQVMDQFYFCSDGVLYRANVDNDETFEWFAEFKPFLTYTTSSSSYSRSFGKQGLTKLTLMLDMTKGSRISVKVKEDDSRWKTVKTIVASTKKAEIVPIRLGRCEYVHIRLEGKGNVILRGLERSYVVGSEV